MKQLKDLLFSSKPKNGTYYTIAIDGRDGSGKSSLVKYMTKLHPDFVFLSGDDYFEPIENRVVWGVFNDSRFIEDVINPLKKSERHFVYKPYDWHAEPHIKERDIEIRDGICLERCYSFLFDVDWDLKIWVETPKEECLKRGIERDAMPKDRMLKAWAEWQANMDNYIKDHDPAGKADLIIYGTEPFDKQIG